MKISNIKIGTKYIDICGEVSTWRKSSEAHYKSIGISSLQTIREERELYVMPTDNIIP